MKRKKTRFSINPKYLLIFFTVLCLVLIVASFKYKEQFTPVKSAVCDVITPMQKGINQVGSFFVKKTEIFTSMKKLLEENHNLQEELDKTAYDNKMLQQEKYELTSLRKLFQLDEKYASYPKVAAHVISKDPGNWYNVFKIDKGKKDGLAIDMNVIAGEGSRGGLVGIITEVGENWAKVRSIIDDNSNVGGMFLKTSETCIVSGNLKLIDKGLLEVSNIENTTTEIKDGLEVVTSHLSEKYHQGILIGYIKDVSLDATKTTQSGHLTPAVDFDRLDTVLVITELKEALEP